MVMTTKMRILVQIFDEIMTLLHTINFGNVKKDRDYINLSKMILPAKTKTLVQMKVCQDFIV